MERSYYRDGAGMVIEALEMRVMLSADGFIKAAGTVLRDGHGSGDAVLLQGTNLGGWLLKEGWMTPMDSSGTSPDDYTARQTLINRFGTATADSLIDSYENSWITTDDLDHIKAMGMNVVRLPFWYRNLQDEDGTWRADAFERMDWLVSNAWARGIYTILDFHGVVGGQSTADHTGRVRSTAEFWSDATDQQRTIDIWTAIATHFKNNPGVAAYDLINEPGGTPNSTTLWNMYDRMYDAIRAVDPDHLITMEGTYGSWNWSMLPNPASYGWTNVMYQMHEYQFGGDATAIKAGTDRQVADFNAHKSWNVPAYVGEWNDFGPAPDPSSVWAYTVGQYQAAGINWSEWSYKSSNGSGTNSWGIYNKLGTPPATPNLQTDSSTVIAQKWNAWKTDSAAAVNPMLLAPLTIGLGPLPIGFTDADVGGPTSAGKASFDPTQGTFTLWGSGADIWGTADQFNFASKDFSVDGTLTALVSNDSNIDPWSKSGVMLRESNGAGSIYAAVLATPGNGVTFQWRNSTNSSTSEVHVTGISAPVWVRLIRSRNVFTAFYSSNALSWTQIGIGQTIAMNASALAGLAVSAHNNGMLNTATFKSFSALPGSSTWQGINTTGWAMADSTPPFDWTVAGGGPGFDGTAIRFSLLSLGSDSDGILKGQVSALTSTSGESKAGLMYLGAADVNAAFGYVYVTPANGVWFKWRSINGGAIDAVQVSGVLPLWLRLIHTGNNIAAYYSADGSNWTQIGMTRNISLPTQALAGLAVTSGDPARLAEAKFSNTSWSGRPSVAVFGTSGNDSFYVKRNGMKIEVRRNLDGSGPPASTVDSEEVRDLAVYGDSGNDTFVLDFGTGDPLLSLGTTTLDGGTGNDVVKLVGMAGTAAVTMGANYITVGSARAVLNGVEVDEIGSGQIGSLTINDSVKARVVSSSLTVGNLSMSAASQLDLKDNDLLLSGGSLGTIAGLVGNARNSGSGGRWTGNGINSSVAAANSVSGLAVLSTPQGVLVKYTWNGDLNGDGVINADDFAIIDGGFLSHGSGYGNGDIDYSGAIDSDDYFYIDQAYLGQSGQLAAPAAEATPTTRRLTHKHHRRRQIRPRWFLLPAGSGLRR